MMIMMTTRTILFCVIFVQILIIDTSTQVVDENYLGLMTVFNEAKRTFNALSQSKMMESRTRPNGPPSLTLLMNFRDDGKTSFQIMQGTEVIYLDNGLCQHGQLFDPYTGQCRDIYCQEVNYKFNGTICIPDDSKKNSTVNKRMSDIDLSLTLTMSASSNYTRGNFSKRLNSQMNKTCSGNFNQLFHDALQTYLDINYSRITKICHSLKNDDQCSKNRPSSTSRSRKRNLEHNDGALIIGFNTPLSNTIIDTLSKNESLVVNFYFTITDRNDTSNDNLTSLHIITLLLLASEFHAVVDLCQDYSVKFGSLAIISDKNKTREEFCSEPDVMIPSSNGIMRPRTKPDGEIDYLVYVPELETIYEVGDYMYLFIVSTRTQRKREAEVGEIISTSPPTSQHSAAKYVSVCNRQPRIVGRCPDSIVMRIALCEVTRYKNFSIRINRTGRLYTNREYRYDELRPDMYIVVCKHDTNNGTARGKTYGFFEKAPGFLSTITMFLSILALFITLITFMLFSSLRNLPGCNVINLIIALMIAETLFISQSLILMTRSSICLLFALGIHYFYLASFFWMNVMAFDLWKTFHKGFSLYVYEIRERLPFYASYAWGTPIIVVLIGIILDVKNARLKPCYGRFFRGCYDVCFRTKADTPLQGCWIESALMRFLLFGFPVAIILIVNFVFYALTVRSIRRGLKKVQGQIENKFHRKKQVVPGEHDVKIYMRMAVLAGFGWTLGFILFILPDGQQGIKRFLVASVKYLFILLNATPGLFIFAVYVCNRRVFALYSQLFRNMSKCIQTEFNDFKMFLLNCRQRLSLRAKRLFKRLRNFNDNNTTISSNTLSSVSIDESKLAKTKVDELNQSLSMDSMDENLQLTLVNKQASDTSSNQSN